MLARFSGRKLAQDRVSRKPLDENAGHATSSCSATDEKRARNLFHGSRQEFERYLGAVLAVTDSARVVTFDIEQGLMQVVSVGTVVMSARLFAISVTAFQKKVLSNRTQPGGPPSRQSVDNKVR